jgi:hypothetical protein
LVFFSKDATSFTVVQMIFATLVLAAFVDHAGVLEKLIDYCRSIRKAR